MQGHCKKKTQTQQQGSTNTRLYRELGTCFSAVVEKNEARDDFFEPSLLVAFFLRLTGRRLFRFHNEVLGMSRPFDIPEPGVLDRVSGRRPRVSVPQHRGPRAQKHLHVFRRNWTLSYFSSKYCTHLARSPIPRFVI